MDGFWCLPGYCSHECIEGWGVPECLAAPRGLECLFGDLDTYDGGTLQIG